MDLVQNCTSINKSTILITGSSGMIGTALSSMLEDEGCLIRRFDIAGQGSSFGDVRDFKAMERAVSGCDGVVHLAAVSRVIWGEQNPELCWDVNVKGIGNLLRAMGQQVQQPWLVFSSSREVYGNAAPLPVTERHPLAPINIYGESKLKSEQMISDACLTYGFDAAILRFSNVFGGTPDHPDRVIPAFIHAAKHGNRLRVDGYENTFDFTYIDDVIHGVYLAINHLSQRKKSFDPVHLVSGVPTTLQELAEMVIEIAESDSLMDIAPPRNYDVAKFFGCGDRAKEILGWVASTPLRRGLAQMTASMITPALLTENQ